MTLSNPHALQERLETIERDLANLQNDMEDAAFDHFRAKREKERARAIALIEADAKTVAEREAIADRETALMGVEAEAKYEAKKAVMRVLDTRAAIGMSLLRAQSRA